MERRVKGCVLAANGAGRASSSFFNASNAFFTSFTGGNVPSSKKRSHMCSASVLDSGSLCQRLRPSRMVRACRPKACAPSSELLFAMPVKVLCTISRFPVRTSMPCHASASLSSDESSGFSACVAAVAANKLTMKRRLVSDTTWPSM